jgi:hypothetical protein
VVTQKGAPSLVWRPASLDHVLGHARLRDLKPKLEQFAVDARRCSAYRYILGRAGSACHASGMIAVVIDDQKGAQP